MDPKKKTRLPAVIVGTTLLIAGALYLFLGDTAVRQSIRLYQVHRHLEAVNQHLAKSPKYAGRVSALSYTGEGGSMMISGVVDSDEEVRNLPAYVELLHCPVTLVYRLRLDDGTPLGSRAK